MITNMVSKESMQKLKEDVDEYKGQEICVKYKLGRNKCEYKEGILSETYPHGFLITEFGTNSQLSYSYNDILTKNVELSLRNGSIVAGDDYSIACTPWMRN